VYELEEHLPHVAEQIDSLPRRAWNDYEAALVFVLTRPFDADLLDDDAPGYSARLRSFGLGRGQIVYRLNADTQRIELDDVSFIRVAGDRS
jgi:hypothetical protein